MDNQNTQDEQDRHRKINDLQREIIMSEADLKKVESEKIIIKAEERRLKKDIDHLRINMQEEQAKLQAVEQKIIMKQTEINHLKKQLNLIK